MDVRLTGGRVRDPTDEPLDATLTRPVAARVVARLERSAVSPNLLSAGSALAGTGAAVGIATAKPAGALAAAILLPVAMVLDAADGQLARARGGGSPEGRVVDGLVDYWVGAALHVGIFTSLMKTRPTVLEHAPSAFELALLVTAAGAAMTVCSMRLDRVKQVWAAAQGARDEEAPAVAARGARRARSWPTRLAWRAFEAYLFAQAKLDRRSCELRHSDARALILQLREARLTGPSAFLGGIVVAALAATAWTDAFLWYCAWAIALGGVHTTFEAARRVAGRFGLPRSARGRP